MIITFALQFCYCYYSFHKNLWQKHKWLQQKCNVFIFLRKYLLSFCLKHLTHQTEWIEIPLCCKVPNLASIRHPLICSTTTIKKVDGCQTRAICLFTQKYWCTSLNFCNIFTTILVSESEMPWCNEAGSLIRALQGRGLTCRLFLATSPIHVYQHRPFNLNRNLVEHSGQRAGGKMCNPYLTVY